MAAKGELARQILAGRKHKDVEIDGVKIQVREVNALQGLTLSTFVNERGLDAGALRTGGEALYQLVADLCVDPESGEAVFVSEQVKQLHFAAFNAIMAAINELMAVPETAEVKG